MVVEVGVLHYVTAKHIQVVCVLIHSNTRCVQLSQT